MRHSHRRRIKKKKMWCSTNMIQGPSFSLKCNANANAAAWNSRQKVVCCCPWSGSDMEKKKSADINNVKLQKSPRNSNHRRLPPAPSLLHLIGLSLYITRSLPYHYPLRDLANTYGPLLHVKLGERSYIVVSSPAMAKEVLKNHDLASADRPKTMTIEVMSYNYSDLVFSPYGHYWKEMRKLCNSELLGPKSTRSFEHIRKDGAALLIQSIDSTRAAPFNLTQEIAVCTGNVTHRALFGKLGEEKGAAEAFRKVSQDPEAIAKIVKKAMARVGSLALADLFPSIGFFHSISRRKSELQKLRRTADVILDYVIDEHRKNRARTGEGYGDGGSEDFVDVLLRMQESDHLQISITDDNIKAVICDIIVGGSETVSSALDWAMAELMKNPRVMAKAQEEIRQAFKGRETIEESEIQILKYLKMVVKETLRLHPPNCLIARACREEFEIDGYHIPLNATILANIWAIARDPDYWANPESFEPERFEESRIDFRGNHFEFIPFGSGKRICPGIAFGIADVEFMLAQLLYHFDWKLPHGVLPDGIDMTESEGGVVSRKNSLYLIARRYDPAAIIDNDASQEKQ